VAIQTGSRIGAYEVISALGAGGMGEVYRARDTTLARDVALKVLPPGVASDPDRIARFRREAQILAALNHPLIAAIYGIDDSSGAPVLVLELVDGPTLAERLEKGPLPLDEAVPIAQQIGRALEAAHQQGIVHRDLKPANIKLRSDGTVKILDFGLARALEPAAAAALPDLAATVSSPALTRIGVILGTAAYMSPEQARGLAVDRGTDIWAFGAVLFEMLTARRAFDGDDPTQTIASVLRTEPDWSRLPHSTPEAVRRVLRRCLEKDRRQRLGDIRDACLDLEEATGTPTAPAAFDRAGLARRERAMWIVALAAVGAFALATTLFRFPAAAPQPRREMHVEIATSLTSDPASFALSPDGEKIAYVAFNDRRSQLWVRSLGSPAAQPLRGTDGAAFPFWSPDSRYIGFFSGEEVRRVALDGTAPAAIGSAVIGPGGTWSREGMILFSVVPDGPLFRMALDSEIRQPVVTSSPAGGGHRYPQFLPDGRHFLYYVAESRGVFLSSLDDGRAERLLESDSAAVLAPPSELLFVRGGNLYVQRFDTSRLELDGEAVQLAADIAVHPYGGPAVSASSTGTIAYRTGAASQERQLVWFDRSGARVGVVGPPLRGGHVNLALSPDDEEVAFSSTRDGNTNISIADVKRGLPTLFTTHPGPDICPVWLPDGTGILYSSVNAAGTGFALNVKPTTRDGVAVPLFEGQPTRAIGMDYSRAAGHALYRTNTGGHWDVWAVPTSSAGAPFPVASSPASERTAQFSPDGKWIAYESNEQGGFEIYIKPFPGPGAGKRASVAGGSQPRWNPRGGELFYIAPDGMLMSVKVELPRGGTELALDTASPLFGLAITSTVQGGVVFEYDVARDGLRFLVDVPVEQASTPISLILNRR
jgi:Tol biopolymer transport system component